MISIPENGSIYKILAIDNGTRTLGAAICNMDLVTGKMDVEKAIPFNTLSVVHKYGDIEDPMNRLLAIRYWIWDLLVEYDPDSVAIEMPFTDKNPHTFKLLTWAYYEMYRTCQQFRMLMGVHRLSPMECKKGIKSLDYSSKLATEEAVVSNPMITLSCNTSIMDEHCYDAVAVGWTHGTKIKVISGY